MYKRKSKFWTFAFSFVPGVGHMYLGLQRQGVQIMLLFFGAIFALTVLQNGLLGIFLPVIWFYSMFDAMSKVASEEMLQDDDIAVVKWIKKESPYVGNKSKYIGFGLIGFGGYMLLERLLLPVVDEIFDGRISHYLQSGFIAVVLIAIGIRLLMGDKSNKSE